VTAASESKRRRRAAIGNAAVIPAKAGIQSASSESKRRRRAAIGNAAVIPVARSADRDPGAAHRNLGPGLRRGDARAERILRGFPPIIDRRTETLILGSFPSEASLAAGQYYAHPRNQFWRLLGELLGEPLVQLEYGRRPARLLAHRVGLWDVIDACRRPGSLDADIREARANDFAALRDLAPRLRRVLFNGGTAGRYARRFAAAGFATAVLPSSSPAHAGRSYAQKLALWRAALPGQR
jgi:hypoxanthine-DNA glycosylase